MASAGPKYRELSERAYAALETAGEPWPAAQIAGAVLGAAFARQPVLVRQLEDLLRDDDRFSCDAGGAWSLSTWLPRSGGQAGLLDDDYAVIDVETTGGRSERHRVVEVGLARLRGGQIVHQYTSLVRPEGPLPRFVTEFSGITPQMLEGAPAADSAVEALREGIGGAVVVGHNVASDLTFLNYEALWHGLRPFGNPALDTEELASRLLPELKRPSLARVASALGIAVPVRHRALADARLAASVLLALLRRAVDGEGITTFDQLQDWLASRLAVRQERVRAARPLLDPSVLRSLPDRPGVYVFRDDGGQALYVGKAVSLRHRVLQHFSGASLAARRHEALFDRTARIDHVATSGELEALLLESAQIRALQPPYNVLERSHRGAPFLAFTKETFPRVAVARLGDRPTADATLVAGPYRTAQAAQQTVEALRRVFQIRSCRRRLPARRAAMRLPCLRLGRGLCPAPCADALSTADYGVLVRFAQIFVSQGRQAALDALDQHLQAARAAGDEPQPLTALLWECRRRLARLRREHRPVEGGRAGGGALLIFPLPAGGCTLFMVRDGVLVTQASLPAAQHPALERVLHEWLTHPPAEPGGLLDEDQGNILLRWLHQHAGDRGVVPFEPACHPASIAQAVLDALWTPAEDPDLAAG